MIKKMITCFLVLFLVACNPVYKTTYTYKPPKSQRKRHCIIGCLQHRQQCESRCQEANSRCQVKQDELNLLADREYNDCVSHSRRERPIFYRRRGRHHHRRKREENRCIRHHSSYFGTCQSNCGCDNTYNQCYKLCGGHVIPHTRCIAFCPKEDINELMVKKALAGS